MSRKLFKLPFILIAGLLLLGFCALTASLFFGSGLALWFIRREELAAEVTPRLVKQVRSLASPTSTPLTLVSLQSAPMHTPLPTATASPSSTPDMRPPSEAPPPTETPLPTATPTPPPTNTPRPLPTPTPLPTETPTPVPPDYPFTIKESARFDTSHLNFDVYIAVVNQDNRPLGDYRVIGTHSAGLQIVSPVSAGDWTVNSGAMHYKAGNIKYEVPNSPAGSWTLQLVDAGNTPVAPPVEFSFDPNSPTWYFLIYQER